MRWRSSVAPAPNGRGDDVAVPAWEVGRAATQRGLSLPLETERRRFARTAFQLPVKHLTFSSQIFNRAPGRHRVFI